MKSDQNNTEQNNVENSSKVEQIEEISHPLNSSNTNINANYENEYGDEQDPELKLQSDLQEKDINDKNIKTDNIINNDASELNQQDNEIQNSRIDQQSEIKVIPRLIPQQQAKINDDTPQHLAKLQQLRQLIVNGNHEEFDTLLKSSSIQTKFSETEKCNLRALSFILAQNVLEKMFEMKASSDVADYAQLREEFTKRWTIVRTVNDSEMLRQSSDNLAANDELMYSTAQQFVDKTIADNNLNLTTQKNVKKLPILRQDPLQNDEQPGFSKIIQYDQYTQENIQEQGELMQSEGQRRLTRLFFPQKDTQNNELIIPTYEEFEHEMDCLTSLYLMSKNQIFAAIQNIKHQNGTVDKLFKQWDNARSEEYKKYTELTQSFEKSTTDTSAVYTKFFDKTANPDLNSPEKFIAHLKKRSQQLGTEMERSTFYHNAVDDKNIAYANIAEEYALIPNQKKQYIQKLNFAIKDAQLWYMYNYHKDEQIPNQYVERTSEEKQKFISNALNDKSLAPEKLAALSKESTIQVVDHYKAKLLQANQNYETALKYGQEDKSQNNENQQKFEQEELNKNVKQILDEVSDNHLVQNIIQSSTTEKNTLQIATNMYWQSVQNSKQHIEQLFSTYQNQIALFSDNTSLGQATGNLKQDPTPLLSTLTEIKRLNQNDVERYLRSLNVNEQFLHTQIYYSALNKEPLNKITTEQGASRPIPQEIKKLQNDEIINDFKKYTNPTDNELSEFYLAQQKNGNTPKNVNDVLQEYATSSSDPKFTDTYNKLKSRLEEPNTQFNAICTNGKWQRNGAESAVQHMFNTLSKNTHDKIGIEDRHNRLAWYMRPFDPNWKLFANDHTGQKDGTLTPIQKKYAIRDTFFAMAPIDIERQKQIIPQITYKKIEEVTAVGDYEQAQKLMKHKEEIDQNAQNAGLYKATQTTAQFIQQSLHITDNVLKNYTPQDRERIKNRILDIAEEALSQNTILKTEILSAKNDKELLNFFQYGSIQGQNNEEGQKKLTQLNTAIGNAVDDLQLALACPVDDIKQLKDELGPNGVNQLRSTIKKSQETGDGFASALLKQQKCAECGGDYRMKSIKEAQNKYVNNINSKNSKTNKNKKPEGFNKKAYILAVILGVNPFIALLTANPAALDKIGDAFRIITGIIVAIPGVVIGTISGIAKGMTPGQPFGKGFAEGFGSVMKPISNFMDSSKIESVCNPRDMAPVPGISSCIGAIGDCKFENGKITMEHAEKSVLIPQKEAEQKPSTQEKGATTQNLTKDSSDKLSKLSNVAQNGTGLELQNIQQQSHDTNLHDTNPKVADTTSHVTSLIQQQQQQLGNNNSPRL